MPWKRRVHSMVAVLCSMLLHSAEIDQHCVRNEVSISRGHSIVENFVRTLLLPGRHAIEYIVLEGFIRRVAKSRLGLERIWAVNPGLPEKLTGPPTALGREVHGITALRAWGSATDALRTLKEEVLNIVVDDGVCGAES